MAVNEPKLESLTKFAEQLKEAEPSAIDLVLKINEFAGELSELVLARVSHLPPDYRRIILDAVARRLKDPR